MATLRQASSYLPNQTAAQARRSRQCPRLKVMWHVHGPITSCFFNDYIGPAALVWRVDSGMNGPVPLFRHRRNGEPPLSGHQVKTQEQHHESWPQYDRSSRQKKFGNLATMILQLVPVLWRVMYGLGPFETFESAMSQQYSLFRAPY